MSGKKMTELDGLRVKVRTSTADGQEWLTATVWIDDRPVREIGRVALSLVGSPGSESCHEWNDAMISIMRRSLTESIGVEFSVKRRKPSYQGERET